MKILLTGGTGFLGRELLKLLLQESRVESVQLLTRQRLTHPDPRVHFLRFDLSSSENLSSLIPASRDLFPDRIIHLAGLYDFSAQDSDHYSQNVLATLNLLELSKVFHSAKPIQVFFASTYTVASALKTPLCEEPLPKITDSPVSYAFTKAVAERLITDSGLPYSVYRIGILVGAQRPSSQIERLDGPYLFLDLLQKLRPLVRYWRSALPLPVKPDLPFPLVPVDLAAKAIAARALQERSSSNVYGLYDSSTARIGEFCESAFERYLPKSKIRYASSPERWLPAVERFFGPSLARAFYFAQSEVNFPNENFKRDHPEVTIPFFKAYQESFFETFERFKGAHR
jgi:nucleoside-diphosphate-sugar epimerase